MINLKKIFFSLISKPDFYYNFFSLTIIILLAVGLLTASNALLLNSDDPSSHLLFAEGFARNGGVAFWENWESLPEGRPHLYPPVYHLFLSALLSFGLDPVLVLEISAFVVTVGLITVSWWYFKKLFGSSFALFYLFFLLFDADIVDLLAKTSPASMALFLSPLIILFLKNKKTIAATLLLTGIFYTHMTFPYFIIFGLLFWSIFNKQYLKSTLVTVAAAFGLFLPWFFWIFKNFNYLRYFNPDYEEVVRGLAFLDINFNLLIIFFIALTGVILFFRRQKDYPDLMFFVGLMIASSPLIFFEPLRFFSSIGGWAMVVIAAYFFNQIFLLSPQNFSGSQLLAKKIVLFFGLIFLIFSTNRLVLGRETNNIIWYKDKNYLSQVIELSTLGNKESPITLKFAYTKSNLDLARIIAANSTPADPILNISNFFGLDEYHPKVWYIVGQFFAGLSDRPMANLRYPENQWQTFAD